MDNYLEHHGILGQRWGIRRYQNEDGSLTKEGKEHFRDKLGYSREAKKKHLRRAVAGAAIGVGLGAVAGMGLYSIYPEIMAYANGAKAVTDLATGYKYAKVVIASVESGALGQLTVQSLGVAGTAAASAVSLGASAINAMGFVSDTIGTAVYSKKLNG